MAEKTHLRPLPASSRVLNFGRPFILTTVNLPPLASAEANLRLCLLLKADDLYFTLGGAHGGSLRDAFLGIPVEGSADENLSEEEIGSIDLERFSIAQVVRQLHAMLDARRLSLDHEHRPDVDMARNDALHYLEHFLSTLPDVALGGLDLTAAGHGEVRRIYDLAYAWLNLIETIEGAFYGETESTLAVNDLALLSGLDTRTLRNRCGPGKLIRTSATRTSQARNSASPAFVQLHALDAVDWLAGRKDFKISQIDPAWIARRLAEATSAKASRGLLVASIINLGPLSSTAPSIGFTPEQAREWFDQGTPLPPKVTKELTRRLDTAS